MEQENILDGLVFFRDILSDGDVVANYRELCDILGWKVTSGASKIKQMEDFGRIYDYKKKGNAFVIKRKRDGSDNIFDGRTANGAKAKRAAFRLKLITFLSNIDATDEISITHTSAGWIAVAETLLNSNKDLTYITKNRIAERFKTRNNFAEYDTLSHEMAIRINEGLNALESAYAIRKEDSILYFNNNSTGVSCAKYATNDEYDKHNRCIRLALDNMDIDCMEDIYDNNLREEFYEEFKSIVKKELGWDKFYDVTTVTYKKEHVQWHLKDVKDVNKLIESKADKINRDISEFESKCIYQNQYNTEGANHGKE